MQVQNDLFHQGEYSWRNFRREKKLQASDTEPPPPTFNLKNGSDFNFSWRGHKFQIRKTAVFASEVNFTILLDRDAGVPLDEQQDGKSTSTISDGLQLQYIPDCHTLVIDDLFYNSGPSEEWKGICKKSGVRIGLYTLELIEFVARLLGATQIELDDAAYDPIKPCKPTMRILEEILYGKSMYEQAGYVYQEDKLAKREAQKEVSQIAKKLICDLDDALSESLCKDRALHERELPDWARPRLGDLLFPNRKRKHKEDFSWVDTKLRKV